MMVTLSLLLAGSGRVQAQAPLARYRAYSVRTPDGLAIAAQDWGNPSGPGILFIHGFAQSHLSFAKQTGSGLAGEFHMVTYDLRGHGSSDKPLEPENYKSAKLWGDELQAVIETTGLKRPVLVGWSYAGRVIIDYLTTHGQDGIAGLVLVDATTKTGPAFNGPGIKNLGQMTSEDLATNIDATRAFIHVCFAKQPTPDEFETMLAFNMMVPTKVRAALGGRPLDADAVLKQLTLPVLVIHGTEDQMLRIDMAKYTAAAIPGAKLSIYEGVGHASFWEDAPRFNRELAEFVRATQKP
jgi:pimeloyl-ACP methyl ester carboxylesterase